MRKVEVCRADDESRLVDSSEMSGRHYLPTPSPLTVPTSPYIRREEKIPDAAIWRGPVRLHCVDGIEAESCQEDSHWCRPQSAASQFILCHPTSGGTAGQRVGRVDNGRECQGHHWGAPRTFQMMPEKMPWHIFSSLSVPSALVETIRCRWEVVGDIPMLILGVSSLSAPYWAR